MVKIVMEFVVLVVVPRIAICSGTPDETDGTRLLPCRSLHSMDAMARLRMAVLCLPSLQVYFFSRGHKLRLKIPPCYLDSSHRTLDHFLRNIAPNPLVKVNNTTANKELQTTEKQAYKVNHCVFMSLLN